MRKLHIFLLFFLIAFLMRFFSFFPSVINHDESTYLVIASSIVKGAVYLRDFIDTKPPGIFYLFAAFLKVTGHSIFLIRLIGSLFVAGTAFFLFLSKLKLSGHFSSSFTTGLLYILVISVYTFYGVSLNTELFFNLFTAIALLMVLTNRNTSWFIAGIAFGMGAMIKYVVLFDAMAFIIFFALISFRNKSFRGLLLRLVLMCLGFLLPIAGLLLYYLKEDALYDLVFHTIRVAQHYRTGNTFLQNLIFFLDFPARFLPVTLFFILVLWKQKSRYHNIQVRLLYVIWFVCDLVSVGIPQNNFGHYFVQAMVPFCFAAGDIPQVMSRFPIWRKIRIKQVILLIALLILANMMLQWNDYYRKPDYPAIMARDLSGMMTGTDILYTGEYHQVIYFLLDRESPTPFVHRGVLRDDHLASVLGFDRHRELARIGALPPDFYLSKAERNNSFKDYLTDDYEIVKTYPNEFCIYKRIKDSR